MKSTILLQNHTIKAIKNHTIIFLSAFYNKVKILGVTKKMMMRIYRVVLFLRMLLSLVRLIFSEPLLQNGSMMYKSKVCTYMIYIYACVCMCTRTCVRMHICGYKYVCINVPLLSSHRTYSPSHTPFLAFFFLPFPLSLSLSLPSSFPSSIPPTLLPSFPPSLPPFLPPTLLPSLPYSIFPFLFPSLLPIRIDDPISDSILTALYRYLCGYGNALLSDPALHRVVYGLMTKLFKRLISALRKLGARVVFASFSRIIIHTDKEVFIASFYFGLLSFVKLFHVIFYSFVLCFI